MRRRSLINLCAALLLLGPLDFAAHGAAADEAPGLSLLVLGSGGPGATGRAGAGYLVMLDGTPRILVDAGPGTFVRVGEAGADLSRLDIVLLTHLHVDHAGELAGLIKARIVSERSDIEFRIFGPSGSDQAVGPNSQRDAKREECYRDWLDAAKTGDFVGVQNYGRQRLNDKGAMSPPAGAELTDSGEEFYPDSLNGAIAYAHAATGKPVVVTENGIDTVDDARRARYVPLAIAGMRRAMAAGAPVLGYVHWSLLDNFEWLFGFGPKYGLVEVDRETFKRKVKPSARVYANTVKAGSKPIHG